MSPPGAAPNRSPWGPMRTRKSISRAGPRRSPSAVSAASTVSSRPAPSSSRRTSSRATTSSAAASGAAAMPIRPLARPRTSSHSAGAPPARGRRGRELGDVADRELVEREVVAVALERARRRQDHVGQARGLVDVGIDRDPEVERGDRGGEAAGAGRRQQRVAGDGDQGAHAARRLDLVGQGRDRQLAEHLGQAAGPAGEPAEAGGGAAAEPAGQGGGRREHRAARAIEVAGEDVDQVDRPAGQGAELLAGRADPAVARGAGRVGVVAGEPADGGGVDAARGGDPLGREPGGDRAGPRRARARGRRRRRAGPGPRRTGRGPSRAGAARRCRAG